MDRNKRNQLIKTTGQQPSHSENDYNDYSQQREEAFIAWFNKLCKESFNAEDVFYQLVKYIRDYDRILYSTISMRIYAYHDDGSEGSKEVAPVGTLNSNLDALMKFSENPENIEKVKANCDKADTKCNKTACKDRNDPKCLWKKMSMMLKKLF